MTSRFANRQLDLFGERRPKGEAAILLERLKGAERGRVNGMTKAVLARRYPAKLPPITVPK